ncbi:MAG TPA: SGNH/GDSL hydrolase family protein [Isosphaeraceae bacterium]|nr:SGNH/GDSL hydrolase family protein [Isosphaeraceae bacterium]
MRLVLELKRRRPLRQRDFEFLRRSHRHERWFKRWILAATCLTIMVLLAALPRGRYLAAILASQARRATRAAIGLPAPRSEIDDQWRLYREHGIDESRQALLGDYARTEPGNQRIMRYAGLDPEHGLLRWGNFDHTLLLPATIFEKDESGRSYRLRPNTRAIWVRNITLETGVLMFFLVPDGPGLAAALEGTSGIPVETSRQTTNSWGLRGPEPDPEAPLRGIVLGDSFMQGMFIGDRETPPECLGRYLADQLKTRVSMLNTGTLGYSPEQYYYSLLAFADRFRPHFVVISVFTNDFGDLYDVAAKGRGDWEEGKYWLDRIVQLCRSRQWVHLIVPVPFESHLFGRRKAGFYPGTLSNILEVNSTMFLDLSDEFINAHLELVIAGELKGQRPMGCPLFNGHIGDGHFSAKGSEVWAAAVGRRLVLLLEKDRVSRERFQKSVPAPARATSPPELRMGSRSQ